MQRKIRLEGGVPDPIEPVYGCVFHTRCPRKIGDICVNTPPPEIEVSPERQLLFPQVLQIVRAYAKSIADGGRVDYRGVNQRELGLEKYVQRVVERLCTAIRPNKVSGETLLLPRLERFRPRGSTKEVLFRTARPTHGKR